MGAISSIASVVRGNEVKVSKASLFELGSDDTLRTDNLAGIQFQYFPESISIQRAVDYQAKDVLGGSHPIYQWVSGSEKVITFKAQFTADEPSYGYDLGGQDNVLSAIENIGAQVSSFLKNPLTTAVSLGGGGKNQPGSKFQYNIQKAATYLLSLTYPSYEGSNNISSRVKPPPKMFLHLPNMGMSTRFDAAGANGNLEYNGMYVLLKSCDFEFTSFFRNGEARTMEVNLSFFETVQIGNNWKFISRENVLSSFVDSNSSKGKDNFNPALSGLNPEASTNVTKKSVVGADNPLNNLTAGLVSQVSRLIRTS